MALVDIIRSGVKTASGLLESVKGDVTFSAWIGQDAMGTDVFADPITVRALIDQTKKIRPTSSGLLTTIVATVTILDVMTDTTPNSPFTRGQPVDTQDKIVLPDGTTAPIVGVAGFMDSATSRGFIGEITLGIIQEVTNQ